jgi:hypothetical protein
MNKNNGSGPEDLSWRMNYRNISDSIPLKKDRKK